MIKVNEQVEVNPRPRGQRATKVEIPPDGIEAQVTERIGGKVVKYDATIKETDTAEADAETTNENDNFESQDDDFLFEVESSTIPKTPLEKMFSHLQYAVSRGEQDTFYAHVTRMPDGISSRFNVPSTSQTVLGVFQFTSRDHFKFNEAIQDKAGRSGGFFNIRVYTFDEQPLTLYYNQLSNRPVEVEVGLVNYHVPNPMIVETPNNNNAVPVSNGSRLETMFSQYIEQTERRFESLIQEMKRQREPSMFEIKLQEKMVNDMLNPPAPKGFDINEFTQQIMMQGTVMAGLGEAFNKMIFREPPAAPEPTTFDKVMEAVNSPIGGAVLGQIEAMSEVFKQRMLPNPQPVAPQAAAPVVEEPNEFQDMINDLLDELESDAPINETNEFIKNLQTNFPQQAGMVKILCKGADFPTMLQMLLEQTAQLQPYPFNGLFDLEKSQAEQQIVWNERGQKVVKRLEEFHAFVRTQP